MLSYTIVMEVIEIVKVKKVRTAMKVTAVEAVETSTFSRWCECKRDKNQPQAVWALSYADAVH